MESAIRNPQSAIPPDAARSLFVYNLFFPLVFLALLPGFLMRMFRRGGFRDKFGQRLGLYSAAEVTRFKSKSWIWIHSISVGETFVALKLARALHDRAPELGILLSTTTSTGFAEVKKAAADWLEPMYNPVDARPIVRRALDLIRPQQVILIEGEVWPNLVSECRRRSIPITLSNARLSPRSERRFRRFRDWTGPIFRLLDRMFVPEAVDIDRWISLGVPSDQLVATGNIKFDNPAATASREAEFRALIEPHGIKLETPIIVAGSTWAPEERVLAAALPELRKSFPDCSLIIVPRHVERSTDLQRELTALGLRVLRRSQLPSPSPSACDVLLVDTTGELRDWYALATVVFVGKSLPGIADVGGQNPAEPAVLGKPVIVGPHMENFIPLMAHLLTEDAIVQIPDAASLAATLEDLLKSPEKRSALGSHARNALTSHAGATMRTATHLCP